MGIMDIFDDRETLLRNEHPRWVHHISVGQQQIAWGLTDCTKGVSVHLFGGVGRHDCLTSSGEKEEAHTPGNDLHPPFHTDAYRRSSGNARSS